MMKKKLQLKILRKIIILNLLLVLSIVFSLIFIFSSFSSMSGLANAIDNSGSERMRTILLGSLGQSYVRSIDEESHQDAEKLKTLLLEEVSLYDQILNELVSTTEDKETLALINQWSMMWMPYKQALLSITSKNLTTYQRTSDLETIQVWNGIEIKNAVNKVVISYTRLSNAKLRAIQTFLFIIIGIVFLLGVITVILVRRSLLPMSSLIHVLRSLQAKNLTVRSAINRNDEVGQISKTLDEMISVFDTLIGNIRETSKSVDLTNEDLCSVCIRISNSSEGNGRDN